MRQAWRVAWLVAVPAVAGVAAWFALRDSGTAEEAHDAEARVVSTVGEGPTLQGRAGTGRVLVPRGTLAIRGKALLSYGKPAAGASVTASVDKVGEVARTLVAVDGTYALEGLAKGLHRVEAVWGEGEVEYGSRGYVAADMRDHDLTLTRRPRTLKIRVLTPAGEPVPRFNARLLVHAGTRDLGLRSEGQLDLEIGLGLTQESVSDLAGTCLELWAARDLDDLSLGFAPLRLGPLAGNERELEARFVAGPAIEGRVLGPDGPVGAPVAFTLSSAPPDRSDEEDVMETLSRLIPGEDKAPSKRPLPAARPPFEGLSTSGKTDAQGAFRVAFHHPEGPHELQVTAPEGFLAVKSVTVRPGDAPLEFRLRKSVTVNVTVLGPDGKPRIYAQVSAVMEAKPVEDEAAQDHDGGVGWDVQAHARADDKGVARLEQLDPERTYVLRAAPAMARRSWHSASVFIPSDASEDTGAAAPTALPHAAAVSIPGWQPAPTVVRLVPGFTLSGIVLDTDNQPVSGAQVMLDHKEHETDDTSTEWSETDPQGRFKFESLSRGTARLSARNGGSSNGMWSGEVVRMMEPDAEVPGLGPPPPGAPEEGPRPNESEVVIATDVVGITLRVPKAYTVTLSLAAEPKPAAQNPADVLRSMFGAGSMMVQVLCKTDDGWRHVTTEFVDPTASLTGKQPTVVVKGLEPGPRYAAWMAPVQGRYVFEEFEAKVGTLTLIRREGASITGRVLDLPKGATHAKVSVRDERGLSVDDVRTDAEGRFEVKGLPPGKWTVSASHSAAGQPHLAAEGQASTGGSVDLRLEVAPEPRPAPRACGSGGESCG